VKYVIKRNEDSAYVAKPGARSYTKLLQGARTWPAREAAERERCGNERVVAFEDEV
jgi:hypothetical protein